MTEEQIEKPEEKIAKPSKRSSFGVIILLLALLACIGGFGFGYFQLAKINLSLAKKVTELQNTLSQQQDTLSGLQKSVPPLSDALQKVETLSSEQEKRLSDWKQAQSGDTDKWKVAQAEYLTKMAQDNLQFSHDVKLALMMVQQANDILNNMSDSKITVVRESLTSDITHLQAIPLVDTTALFLQLKTLNEQIDKLPLPKTSLQAEAATAKTMPSNLSWWKVGLQKSWEMLGKIVIVRKNETTTLPLVLPEEIQHLYQNMHAQIENAIWGLLHGNKEVYQESLSRLIASVKEYFVQDAGETKAMLQALITLQQTNIVPADYSLAGTLKQFNEYFAETKAAQ